MREGFGRVLIEAMAAGVPVIGTRVGGIPEIIEDGVNGYIVSPDNPKELRDAIVKVLEKVELYEKFAAEGLRVVKEKFSIEDNIRKIVSFYDNLLK